MTFEFKPIDKEKMPHYSVKPFSIQSIHLNREIFLDAYLPQHVNNPSEVTLMLINDGQDMELLGLTNMLEQLSLENKITPILAIGIWCNEDRRLEYGTADILDYESRGSMAKGHRQFIIDELLPYIQQHFFHHPFREIAFAGFSLGGLSALDIAWKHPEIFTKIGAFSGSFWWRTKALDAGYVEETDRIMHKLVREGVYAPNQKFFFSTGTLDETADRNNNGIIDSIDDTLGLISELEKKGYNREEDIQYLELQNGRHDVQTWGVAMPYFLKWGWGK